MLFSDKVGGADLAIRNMVENRSLAKAIHDAGWGEQVRQLECKAVWFGVTVVKAGRCYPSSKTCSKCGAVKAKLSLTEREYHCSSCGTRIGRDVNAAINLARIGDPSWEIEDRLNTLGGWTLRRW